MKTETEKGQFGFGGRGLVGPAAGLPKASVALFFIQCANTSC